MLSGMLVFLAVLCRAWSFSPALVWASRKRHRNMYLFYAVAYRILNNASDAEDAVHDAFIKIAENMKKISDPVCPKTQSYVVTIVENKAIDLYRRKQRVGG